MIVWHKKVRRLLQHPQLTGVIVVTPENLSNLEGAISYLQRRGFSEIRIQHMVRVDVGDLEEMRQEVANPHHRAIWTWGEQLDKSKMNIENLAEFYHRIQMLKQQFKKQKNHHNFCLNRADKQQEENLNFLKTLLKPVVWVRVVLTMED